MDISNGKIRVYNYEMSPVGFPSQKDNRGVFFEGREEDQEYVMERVYWDDIDIENNKSDVFKIGRLRFHPDEEEEIYKKLGITDRENIMNDMELMRVLKDESVDNLKRIYEIKSRTLITRMKEMLFRMERNGQIPPHNVITVVSERAEEFKNGGVKNQDSYINKIIKQEKEHRQENEMKELVLKLNNKVNDLEKQNKEKDEMLVQSQSAMKDLLKMVEDLKKQDNSQQEANKTTEKEAKPKAGRTPKTDK